MQFNNMNNNIKIIKLSGYDDFINFFLDKNNNNNYYYNLIKIASQKNNNFY